MSAVVYQTDILRIQVLPCPVQPGQFAIVGVLGTDIVSGIVLYIAKVQRITVFIGLPFCPDMDGQLHRIVWHPVFLMGCDDQFDIHQNSPS